MGLLDKVFLWLGHARYYASPTAVSNGEVVELLSDSVGRLQVALSAAAPAGVTAVRQLTAANEGALKAAGPGSLVEVALWNNGAVALWFQVHDKSAAVTGGDACVDQVMVPPGGAIGWRPAVPVAASTRLRWAASTTPGTCTVPGVAAMGFSGAVLLWAARLLVERLLLAGWAAEARPPELPAATLAARTRTPRCAASRM